MENIIVVGASGHAKVIIDIVEKQNKYKIKGLIDPCFAIGCDVLGYKVLGKDSDFNEIIKLYDVKGAIVAIGDNKRRFDVATRLKEMAPKISFVTAIHPNSCIGQDVHIDEGSVIMAGAIINASSRIGRFCIVNTNSSIDHDTILEEYTSVAPGSTVGGNCRIGAHSAICIGATIYQGVVIGNDCVIGGGSLVLNNFDNQVVAYGVPAKVIRKRSRGDKYL